MSSIHAKSQWFNSDESAAPRFSGAAVGLLAALLLSLYVGFSPFPGASQSAFAKVLAATSGNVRNQIVWTGLCLVAVGILYANPGRTFQLLRKTLPLVILVMFCLASILWASEPELAARRVVRLSFDVIIVAGIVVGISSPRMLLRVVILVTGAAMAVNLIGVLALPGLAKDLEGRFIGMYGHPNNAGLHAMLAIFIWLSAARWAPDRNLRWALLFGVGLWFIFLFGTQSKTSITLAIAVPIFVLMLQYCLIRPRLGIPIGLIASVLFFAGIFLALVLDLSFIEVLALAVVDTTFTGRAGIWEIMLQEIGKRPFLGIGYGSFWATGYSSPVLGYGDHLVERIFNAHNGYLDIAATLGGIGLAIFTVMIIYGLVNAFKATVSATEDRVFRQTVQLSLYIMFSMLVHNITVSSFLLPSKLLWMFFLLAFFMVCARSLGDHTNLTITSRSRVSIP